MLNVHNRYRDFRGVATYLLRPAGEVEPERVAWTATRNLPSDDPDLVVGLMRATAARSLQVQKPAYHIALAFAPEDPVDRGTIERVADRVLTHLRLNEHQALLVAHRDRPHAHVHMLINLVHPETGRARPIWNDWLKVREVMRAEEHALGLRPQGAPRERVPALALELHAYERVAALGQQLYRAEGDTNTASDRGTRLELAAEQARKTLAQADRALAQVYREPLVAFRAFLEAADTQGPAAAAKLMRHLPERLGVLATVERRGAFERHLTADDRAARTAAPDAATAAQEALEATRAFDGAVESAVHRVEQQFDQALAALYQKPAAARLAFERLVRDHGAEQGANLVLEQPSMLGSLLRTTEPESGRAADKVNWAVARGVEDVQARDAAAALHANPREATTESVRALSHLDSDRAAARARTLRAELQSLPSIGELERRIRYGLDRLPSFGLRQLKATVTAPQFALALRIGRIARDIALGREEEHELAR